MQSIPNYSITRFFWLLTGLSPEEAWVHVRVQQCFVTICILSVIFTQVQLSTIYSISSCSLNLFASREYFRLFQCGMLITHEFSYAYCVKIATYIMPNIVYLVKYATFIIYSDQVSLRTAEKVHRVFVFINYNCFFHYDDFLC